MGCLKKIRVPLIFRYKLYAITLWKKEHYLAMLNVDKSSMFYDGKLQGLTNTDFSLRMDYKPSYCLYGEEFLVFVNF